MEKGLDFFGFLDEFGFVFEEGEDGGFDGGDAWFEAHDGADVFFAVFFGEVFFFVGFTEEGKDGAIATGGGLDDVGNEFFFGGFVEVFEWLSRVFLVFGEVVVGAVGDAFQFLLSEGEVVFDVVGFLGVMSAFTVGDVEDVEFFTVEANFFVEAEAGFEPFVGEAESVFGAAEVFDFHLFKFA